MPGLTAPVLIRPARSSELPDVLDLWGRARSAAASTPDTLELLATLLRSTDSALLVALVDDGLAGTLIVAWDGWRGHMYRLAVTPELRRRGIGAALLEAGHAHLAARGATRVDAIVVRGDEVAAALWVASGYELQEGVERYVRSI